MTMLRVKDLSVRYGDLSVLDGLSFSVEEGQWLMIVGPNGAGKSTALGAVTQGIPYSGEVLLYGEDVKKIKPRRLARSMGMLAQSNLAAYGFSVEEVAALGRYAYSSGLFSGPGEGDKEAVETALRLTGMEGRRGQSILTLSGGELQRTFLAQVFAQDPKLLLLDEPANHLDLVYQKQVFGILSDWLRTPGRAVVSVVHDLSLARAYGTNALLMDKGRNLLEGEIQKVLAPGPLDEVYRMDVGEWMRKMLSQWAG